LSTSELYEILTEIGLNDVLVLPEDGLCNLPTPLEGGVVLNYESSHESGSHWYSLYIRGEQAYVFDSLGAPPDDSVIDWANRNNITLITSTAKAQSNSSSLCGLWAIWFLSMIRTHSYSEITRLIERQHTYRELTDILTNSLANSLSESLI